MNNKDWSEKILQKFDLSFKHRWIVYNNSLIESLNSESIWLDCDDGNNGLISSFGNLCKTSIGINLVKPETK